MSGHAVALSLPPLPPEVCKFATEKGVNLYLAAVIDLARTAFPSSLVEVSLGQDAEDETHQYIALDVVDSGQSSDNLLAGQRIWSAGVSQICPQPLAVYFVLGWR